MLCSGTPLSAVRQEEDVGSSKIKRERHVPMNLDQADLAENG